MNGVSHHPPIYDPQAIERYLRARNCVIDRSAFWQGGRPRWVLSRGELPRVASLVVQASLEIGRASCRERV